MQEELKGTVERITFYSEEDGYTVARFQPEGLEPPTFSMPLSRDPNFATASMKPPTF